MTIMLEGSSIEDLSRAEILIRSARNRSGKRDGIRNDHYDNLRLIALFGNEDILSVPGLIDRSYLVSRSGWSDSFCVFYAGQVLAWGIHHGLAALEGDDFRLLEREPQWELCGPERKQIAVRVRGLQGPEAVIAARTWSRELKRRERARAKYTVRVAAVATRGLDHIATHAPETKLPEPLARFAVSDFDTITACRQLILDDLLAGSEKNAETIRDALCASARPIDERLAAARKAAIAEEERIRREEEGALADLVLPPPPAPRVPVVYPAEVTKRHARGGYMGTDHYTFEGSLEAVLQTIEIFRARDWRPNGIDFSSPTEIEPGHWCATGTHHCGTD